MKLYGCMCCFWQYWCMGRFCTKEPITIVKFSPNYKCRMRQVQDFSAPDTAVSERGLARPFIAILVVHALGQWSPFQLNKSGSLFFLFSVFYWLFRNMNADSTVSFTTVQTLQACMNKRFCSSHTLQLSCTMLAFTAT